MLPILRPYFSSVVPDSGVPIAYIKYPKIVSTDQISIIDHSYLIQENTLPDTTLFVIENTAKLLQLVKTKFLITDKLYNNEPLFYKHVLTKDIYIDDLNNPNIAIFDSSGNRVPGQNYIFVCKNNSIYHSLTDDIYFIEYPAKDINGNLIDKKFRELLTAGPAFTELAPEHLDNNCFDADKDYYLIENLNDDGTVDIKLPRTGTYAVKYLGSSLLKLLHQAKNQAEPWYISLYNNEILTIHTMQDSALRYKITEFDVQNFYPFYPIKFITNLEAEIIGPSVISTGVSYIYLSIKTPIDILVYNVHEQLVRAITTDKLKAGKAIGGLSWEIDGLVNVDTINGNIYTNYNFIPGSRVYITCYYKADSYEYTGYNFNPLFNPNALTDLVVILCSPEEKCKTSIHQVVFNAGVATASNNPDILNWIQSGSKSYDDLIADWCYVPNLAENNINNYMLIGAVTVNTSIGSTDVEAIDIRRLGGGIAERYTNILDIMPGAISNLDIGYFNGPAVPLQGAVLIFLPSRIKLQYTELAIKEKIRNYLSAGSEIIIRYY